MSNYYICRAGNNTSSQLCLIASNFSDYYLAPPITVFWFEDERVVLYDVKSERHVGSVLLGA